MAAAAAAAATDQYSLEEVAGQSDTDQSLLAATLTLEKERARVVVVVVDAPGLAGLAG